MPGKPRRRRRNSQSWVIKILLVAIAMPPVKALDLVYGRQHLDELNVLRSIVLGFAQTQCANEVRRGGNARCQRWPKIEQPVQSGLDRTMVKRR